MRLTFPQGFQWGTSTAAAQIETAYEHTWLGVKARDGAIFARTTDHELRRAEDAGYISQFGTWYRCSVDWARLQPAALEPFHPALVEEYRQFFADLRSGGMNILFVLHHFAHPKWFEAAGGWLNEDNISRYFDFVRRCISAFGEFAGNWNTFNEPNVFALNGYVLGHFPPFRKNLLAANRVLTNMGKAHRIAYDLLKSRFPEVPVGISFNTAWFEGIGWLGKLPAAYTSWWFHSRAERHFTKVDYWGLSYYAYVPFAPLPLTELDRPGALSRLHIAHDKMWGYRPEGLGRMLRRFWRRYRKPLLITENGICTDDPQERIERIRQYLTVCHKAIGDGVDLRGYIHWSTWDNFEWHLGPSYRFGLVSIDRHTMTRSMTPAGEFFSQVARDNAIDV
jgi:beta-glucosidase